MYLLDAILFHIIIITLKNYYKIYPTQIFLTEISTTNFPSKNSQFINQIFALFTLWSPQKEIRSKLGLCPNEGGEGSDPIPTFKLKPQR